MQDTLVSISLQTGLLFIRWFIAIAFEAQLGSRLLCLFTPQTVVSWGLVLLCLSVCSY